MNFALLLFSLLVVTGAVALADRLWFAKARREGEREPWWIEYPKSFFPVILIVFVLRSFLVVPFKIPSGSMVPTLLVGDFILVNKFAYGVRLPIINVKMFEIGRPRRGDVMVFRYPEDPSLDYIKRVVGLPGDRVSYVNKRLYINGVEAPRKPLPDYLNRERIQYSRQFSEQTGEVRHAILIEEEAPPMVPFVRQFPFRDNCNYNDSGVTCTVPRGHYFMMGDNRDNSADSRVWGFVPDENIVGKAFFIWFNFSDLGRIGSFK
ncbi:MAG: signal peptidase I [Betaproteobacteria bacterium]|nr:signal peptidase I [Betaproteobacteria bacterium]